MGTWAKHLDPSQQSDICATTYYVMLKIKKTWSSVRSCLGPSIPTLGFLEPFPFLMTSTRICGAIQSPRMVHVESSWIVRSHSICVLCPKTCLLRMLDSLAVSRSCRMPPLFHPSFLSYETIRLDCGLIPPGQLSLVVLYYSITTGVPWKVKLR